MIDVTALGESLIDFTPAGENAQGIPLFAQSPGGAPANVLAMIARLGEQGACYRNHACSGVVPSCPVEAVDTTGAGDAFVGALLWKVRHMLREELCFLPRHPCGRSWALPTGPEP